MHTNLSRRSFLLGTSALFFSVNQSGFASQFTYDVSHHEISSFNGPSYASEGNILTDGYGFTIETLDPKVEQLSNIASNGADLAISAPIVMRGAAGIGSVKIGTALAGTALTVISVVAFFGTFAAIAIGVIGLFGQETKQSRIAQERLSSLSLRDLSITGFSFAFSEDSEKAISNAKLTRNIANNFKDAWKLGDKKNKKSKNKLLFETFIFTQNIEKTKKSIKDHGKDNDKNMHKTKPSKNPKNSSISSKNNRTGVSVIAGNNGEIL